MALAEGAALGRIEGGGDIGLQYIRVGQRTLPEAILSGEAVFMGGVPPGGGRLVPSGVLLRQGQMSVIGEG
jgi:hypothetical protein